MFRISRNISPPIMNDIFKQKDNSRYNMGQISEFSRWSQYTTEGIVLHFHDVKYGKSYRWLKRYDYKDIGNLTLFRIEGKQKGPLSTFPL